MHTDKLALLCHGFNVSDKGEGTIGRLRPYFTARGWDTIMFDMGWMDIIQVYTQNRRHAERVAIAAINAKRLGQRVAAVGHSNGCCVIHIATAEFDAPIDYVTYINPALDNGKAPGKHVQLCHVWHSPSDKAVKWAKRLPASDWGDMGAVGYTGTDPRVINHNKELMVVPSAKHSDFADEPNLAYYGPLITSQVNQL